MALRVFSSLGRFLVTTAYVIQVNRRRLIVLGLMALGLFILAGGAREVLEGIGQLIASAPGMLFYFLFLIVAMIVQFGALMWFLSRPRQYTVTPDQPQIGLSFNDYRGQPDLVEHAKSLVRILQGVEKFRQLGGEPPKGMLLAGPPGTGKSFLAGVVAAEAQLPFIYVDASSLTSMWLGMDALIVVSLFSKARRLGRKFAKPGHPGACIVFIDELDSIGLSRGGMRSGQAQGGMGPMGMMGGFQGMALNTLLNQMDSLGQHVEDRWSRKVLRWLGVITGPVPLKPVIFVVGATNRPDVLDAALVRPGRLDRRLNVYPPDGPGRKDIVKYYLDKKAHDPNIPLDLMVADSIGWTPIDIKTIINEALIVAHDAGRDMLTYKDWLVARDARQLGIKQPAQMSQDDKRAVAYHEAGHAVAAYYLQQENRIQKASIIRMGDALGVVTRSPKEERYTRHAREMETDIMVSLASRAVEECILHTKMAGAHSDLQNATNVALAYLGAFGMGSTLLAVPGNALGGVPEPVLRIADRFLWELYDETKRLIVEKEQAVHAIAAELVEKGELIGQELEIIFRAVDTMHPECAKPFEREPVVLPKLWELPEGPRLQPVEVPAAAAAADAPRNKDVPRPKKDGKHPN